MKYLYRMNRVLFNRLHFLYIIILFCILVSTTRVFSADSLAVNLFTGEKQYPDTMRIRLHDAIFMGLKNNPAVTIERLNPDIMNTFVREERAAFDPELSANGQKSEVKSLRRLGAQRTPFDLRDKRFDVEVQLSEDLPTGTSIAVGSGMTGSVSNLYTDQFTGNLNVTITQSLLQGFGFGANLARLRQAQLDLEISRTELKGVAETITAEIEKSYWDLYLTRQEMEIQQKSLELVQQQLAESLERVAVGKLPKLELAAVDAEVAARRGILIDSQSRYEQARIYFLYLLNPEKNDFWPTIPVPLDKPFLPVDKLDEIAVHEQLGNKYRPDLKQARFALDKGKLNIARTKNGLLPRLDVFITLGRTTYSESFGNAYPDIHSPFYQAFGGFNFVFPLPNRKASAQLARARFSHEQQQLAVKNLEKLVEFDVRSAYVKVEQFRQQIEATRVTRELQEKKYAAEMEKFRVGKSTNFLVLQAQRDLTASQLDEARFLVSYLNALVNLYRSEGTLLERRGINTFDL